MRAAASLLALLLAAATAAPVGAAEASGAAKERVLPEVSTNVDSVCSLRALDVDVIETLPSCT